ncbi:EpsG family protein [Methylosinus sp. Sm6]|uniref:EpsG family protein n=1 Tax=Methylosinus sp. Sm6 TaxID=2866948 RepID=UPI001C9A2BA7|nr:EpsG family protein [Methylosinus sp. Sm6]MBY6242470.1 EpsG family protein [Methylosinus sp. Sm6]
MLPYWLMFLAPALLAASSSSVKAPIADARKAIVWDFVWLSLTLLIGFRHEVGGDWASYERMLDNTAGLDLGEVLLRGDPGYNLFNWISVGLGWDIYGVNLAGGAIFSFGLLTFCRAQPQPWLALAVAMPYLVIVVAMGYSRQGIALGFTMLGFVALCKGSNLKFAIWIALGATFHKTAVLIMPIAALASSKNRYATAAWIALLGAGLYKVLLEKDADNLYRNYVTADMQSEGALVRTLMGAVPAIIFLVWRKRFQLEKAEADLWTWLAVIAATLPVALAVTSASTAIDRMALYMLPLQLVVFARMPDALATPDPREGKRTAVADAPVVTAAILVYYGAVLFVWLNFATYAHFWLPYQFYPWDGSF